MCRRTLILFAAVVGGIIVRGLTAQVKAFQDGYGYLRNDVDPGDDMFLLRERCCFFISSITVDGS